jgi:soluble lytic murein transglycosylase-like protein
MRLIIVFCGLLCVTPVRSLEVSPEGIFFAYSSSTAPVAGMQSLGHTAYDTRGNTLVMRPESSVVFTKSELCSAAASVARANNLPIAFFTNLIQQESGFKPTAISRAGAQGIAQFMPRVATWLGLADPLAPITAVHASGNYLQSLLTQFGNVGPAAAAYNAGPRRVRD